MLTDSDGEQRNGIEVRYRLLPTDIGWCRVPDEMDFEVAFSDWDESVSEFYETIRDLMLAGF